MDIVRVIFRIVPCCESGMGLALDLHVLLPASNQKGYITKHGRAYIFPGDFDGKILHLSPMWRVALDEDCAFQKIYSEYRGYPVVTDAEKICNNTPKRTQNELRTWFRERVEKHIPEFKIVHEPSIHGTAHEQEDDLPF